MMQGTRTRGGPIMGFLGGAGAMIVGTVFWTVALAFALTLIWPPATTTSEFGLARIPYAFFTAIVMGLVGLAMFSARVRDWVPLLGGLVVAGVELALFMWLAFPVSPAA